MVQKYRYKFKKRLGALILCLVMIFSIIPMTAVQSFAAVIDTDADGNVVVTSIKYAVDHDIFAAKSGYVEILGTNLLDVDFLFEMSGQGFEFLQNKDTNTNTFIKYSLTAEEVENFTGRIKAGSLIVDLDSSDFPNIQGSDKQTINKDDATPYSLECTM